MQNDPVNDIVVSGIAQNLPMQKAQQDLLQRVETLIEKSVEDGNPQPAAQAMKALIGISRMSGLASAKCLYMFKIAWDRFPQSKSQTFENFASDEFGYDKATVKRYNRVWEMLVSGDIPKEYAEKMKLLSIKSLIQIAATWEQGWEIEPHHWMMLSQAPDAATVSKILRENIKKTQPKAGSLNIEWHAEEMKVVGWKDGKPHTIYLQFDNDDEVCQQILARLFGDGRALEK